MANESWVHARLNSSLSAFLAYAVELSIPTITADLGAARVFDVAAAAPPAYVSAGRLGVSPGQEPSLHAWPTEAGSVFEQLRPWAPHARTFRVGEVLTGSTGAEPEVTPLFGPIAACRTIVDTLGMSVPVAGSAWCLFVLMRCDRSPPFETEAHQRLERLRESLAEALRRGYQQEVQRGTATAAASHHAALAEERSTRTGAAGSAEGTLLDRLSHTEQDVLSHLRRRRTERQIAEQLDRSPHTVHVHVKNIYRKLAVRSRRELLELFEEA